MNTPTPVWGRFKVTVHQFRFSEFAHFRYFPHLPEAAKCRDAQPLLFQSNHGALNDLLVLVRKGQCETQNHGHFSTAADCGVARRCAAEKRRPAAFLGIPCACFLQAALLKFLFLAANENASHVHTNIVFVCTREVQVKPWLEHVLVAAPSPALCLL